MGLSVPHNIVKLQSRNVTNDFETKYGKLLGNHNNQYHNHSFAHHFWFGCLSVKGLSLDGSFCDGGSADSMSSSAGRREHTCKWESPDPGNSMTKICRELICESGGRDLELGVVGPRELYDQHVSRVDL